MPRTIFNTGALCATLLMIAIMLTKTLSSSEFCSRDMVITQPVVDMSFFYPLQPNMAASPIMPEVPSCDRAHQGLFNEIVEFIEEKDDAIKIKYHTIIHGFQEHTQQPDSTFWMHKNDAISLRELIDTPAFAALCNPANEAQDTITLIYPWNQLSVGTTLVHLPEQDTLECFAILLGNYHTGSVDLAYVPRTDAIVNKKRSPQEARTLFVTLVNNLIDRVAHDHPGQVIPYVWGGSSFVYTHTTTDFYPQEDAWHRRNAPNPYTGYDCSELIMRMAHIAGITFPWKNSTLMGLMCTALDAASTLEEGDIIWVPGHVMVVGNKERNELIEARGYQGGFGCLHRITLTDCFVGITTFDELVETYRNKFPLIFCDKAGRVCRIYHTFKILKLLDT